LSAADVAAKFRPTMTMTISTQEQTLGPLTGEQRALIMQHARPMSIAARRTFRRLLILAQDRGLSPDTIARTARQAHEHDAG
jgi:hypothetical protein